MNISDAKAVQHLLAWLLKDEPTGPDEDGNAAAACRFLADRSNAVLDAGITGDQIDWVTRNDALAGQHAITARIEAAAALLRDAATDAKAGQLDLHGPSAADAAEQAIRALAEALTWISHHWDITVDDVDEGLLNLADQLRASQA